MKFGRLWRWLQRRAENVAAGLLAVMFVAFILQIVFRYLFNFPIGWSTELTILTWVYLVLWGSAFVLTEKEEIRFDLIYGSVGPRARIAMAVIFSISIVVLYSIALPATWSYVSFMKVEKSSYLKIPLHWLYSIYLVFCVAVIVRYLWLLSRLLRGKDPEAADLTKVSSGL
ncbi:MAG TPA: TRAP transporter small permease [Burkholderiales bacterium]|nr:TRAP transporter small permease [Burkholderiales bacterium]